MTPEYLDRFAAAFTVLSRLLLAAPDDEVLARLRDPAVLADWPVPEGAEEGLRLLATSAEAVEAVREDHARLFVGPGPVSAIPYESVHRSEERLLFEVETLQVRAAYASLGLQAPRLHREPDDHIGLELEFLATAYTKALTKLDAGESADVELGVAEAFERDHVLAWGPALFGLVAERAGTDFYRGVGRLGESCLAQLAASSRGGVNSSPPAGGRPRPPRSR